METPLNPLVADIVSTLGPSLREDFEERAAIMEFEANLDRAHAECLALLHLLRCHPTLLTGVTLLQVEAKGAVLWLLTTQLDCARQHLTDIGAVERGICDLAKVIDQHYSGIAALAPLE